MGIGDWRTTPCVTGRLATEDDVRNGSAVFCIGNANNCQARPLDMQLPRLARFTDDETGTTETVIVIQAEDCIGKSASGLLEMFGVFGYRMADGSLGACSAEDITWIDDPSEIDVGGPKA